MYSSSIRIHFGKWDKMCYLHYVHARIHIHDALSHSPIRNLFFLKEINIESLS